MKMDYKHNLGVNKLSPLCCNYSDGNCMALDCRCVILGCKTSILCRWFIQAVLPVDKVLYTELQDFNRITTSLYVKNCKTCKGTFKSQSKTAQYCDKCRDKSLKARYRKYNASRGAI